MCQNAPGRARWHWNSILASVDKRFALFALPKLNLQESVIFYCGIDDNEFGFDSGTHLFEEKFENIEHDIDRTLK